MRAVTVAALALITLGCGISGPDTASQATLSVETFRCPFGASVASDCEPVSDGDTMFIQMRNDSLFYADSVFYAQRLSWSANGTYYLNRKVSWIIKENNCPDVLVQEGDRCIEEQSQVFRESSFRDMWFDMIIADTVQHWYEWSVFGDPEGEALVTKSISLFVKARDSDTQ